MKLQLLIPQPSPLYDALWRARKKDESMPTAAVRLLRSQLLPRPPVPSAPILSFVEVLP